MATSLEIIKTTPVTAGVVTINVDNVFTDKYKMYQVIFDGIYHDTDISNGIEGIRLIDSGGSVITQSEYSYMNHNVPMALGSSVGDNLYPTRDFIFLNLYADQQSDGTANAIMNFYKPYESDTFTYVNSQAAGLNSSNGYAGKTIGVHRSAETIRGFQLYESNGARTFGGGKIIVYGVK
tara:strand:+ start:546 stop:1082 length:537 start_codon:yes stop_codon:yes gene_type:complete